MPETKGLSLEQVDLLYRESSIIGSDKYRREMLSVPVLSLSSHPYPSPPLVPNALFSFQLDPPSERGEDWVHTQHAGAGGHHHGATGDEKLSHAEKGNAGIVHHDEHNVTNAGLHNNNNNETGGFGHNNTTAHSTAVNDGTTTTNRSVV